MEKVIIDNIRKEILTKGAALSIAARIAIAYWPEDRMVDELKDLERVYGSLYKSDDENPWKIYQKLKKEYE